ncbi:nucleoside-triphosphatase [Candidatus Riflebacteria bacterium]
MDNEIIIIDEIGKMECFSGVFRKAVLNALDSTTAVLGTITLGGDAFIRAIKKRRDLEIIEVTTDNRDAMPDYLLEVIAKLTE